MVIRINVYSKIMNWYVWNMYCNVFVLCLFVVGRRFKFIFFFFPSPSPSPHKYQYNTILCSPPFSFFSFHTPKLLKRFDCYDYDPVIVRIGIRIIRIVIVLSKKKKEYKFYPIIIEQYVRKFYFIIYMVDEHDDDK